MCSAMSSSRKEEELEREDDEDSCQKKWLELALGLGPARQGSESDPRPGPSRAGLADRDLRELGLGLRLGNDSLRTQGDGHGQLQQQPQEMQQQQQESSSASLPSLPPPPLEESSSSCHVRRPGQLEHGNPLPVHNWARPDGPRPGAGLWFSLHASSCSGNGVDEALPQIPKAYIRVKDESVTVFMVKRYLVRKLGLTNEAEIEITCMGEQLVQSQTLKEVRDAVWLPKMMGFRLDESARTSLDTGHKKHARMDHFMSLQYQRSSRMALSED